MSAKPKHKLKTFKLPRPDKNKKKKIAFYFYFQIVYEGFSLENLHLMNSGTLLKRSRKTTPVVPSSLLAGAQDAKRPDVV